MDALLRWDPFRASLGEGGVGVLAGLRREGDQGRVHRPGRPARRQGGRHRGLGDRQRGDGLRTAGAGDAAKRTSSSSLSSAATGTFMRTLTLPDGANLDDVRADLKDGVLSLVDPQAARGAATQDHIGKESKAKSYALRVSRAPRPRIGHACAACRLGGGATATRPPFDCRRVQPLPGLLRLELRRRRCQIAAAARTTSGGDSRPASASSCSAAALSCAAQCLTSYGRRGVARSWRVAGVSWAVSWGLRRSDSLAATYTTLP